MPRAAAVRRRRRGGFSGRDCGAKRDRRSAGDGALGGGVERGGFVCEADPADEAAVLEEIDGPQFGCVAARRLEAHEDVISDRGDVRWVRGVAVWLAVGQEGA